MGNSKCGNCSLYVDDEGQELLAEFTSFDEDFQVQVSTSIETALNTVFEHGIRLNQNNDKAATRLEDSLKMCCQCSSVLAELYRLYLQFMKLTKQNSHVQLLIGQSLLWPHSQQENSLLNFDTGSVPNNFESAKPASLFLVKQEEILPDVIPDQSDEEPGDPLDPLLSWSEESGTDEDVKPIVSILSENRRVTRSQDLTVDIISGKSPTGKLKNCDNSVGLKRTDDKRTGIGTGQSKSTPSKFKKSGVSRECPECGLEFPNRGFLWRHQRKIHLKIPLLTLTCPESDCGKVCHKDNELAWHLLVAHGIGDKVEGQQCPSCSKYFSSASKMIDHKRDVHCAEEDKVQCSKCPRKFSSQSRLDYHLKTDHDKPADGYKCDECAKVYQSRLGLRAHKLQVHNPNPKVYKCPVCHKTSIGPDFLYHHNPCPLIREKNLKCSHCDKTFGTRQSLRLHEKCFHGQAEHCVCSECGDKFTRKVGLKRHMQAKHSNLDEAAGPFVCETCGKSFKVQDYLRQHKRSKTHGGVGHGLYTSSGKKRLQKTARNNSSSVTDSQ